MFVLCNCRRSYCDVGFGGPHNYTPMVILEIEAVIMRRG